MSLLDTIKHLLPRGRAWRLTINKTLRQFFSGLAGLPDNVKEYADLAYLDLFPADTRELDAWEDQWGLPETGLSTADRRTRLASTWAQIGGQDPRYIQDTVQAAGFDGVYIHEWWIPASSPVQARSPIAWLLGFACECDEDLAECGEAGAMCGELTPEGEHPSWLVNKLQMAGYDWLIRCGETLAECGEAGAQCGEYDGFRIERRTYALPTNPSYWPYFIYFGDSTFGDSVVIDDNRRDEFENLLLKLCPTQNWIGLFIDFAPLIVEDASGDILLEDASGESMIE
jgi:hypothetical protein